MTGSAWQNISVRVDANVEGFVGKMGAAAGAVRGLGREVTATATNTEAKFKNVTAMAGKVSLAVGAAGVGTFLLAERATIGFDKALSNLNAVSSATTEEMGQLRQAALDAGAATVFSARQSAEAEAELARAGVSTRDILRGGLRGALDLAAAGQLQLNEAAITTAQGLNIFQLKGNQATRVADTLAAGANKSAADVHQLGEAMRMGGLVGRQMGLSLEDTVGTLALFADNALIGSDGGTSFKVMLQRLVPQTKEAAAMQRHLGLSFFDSRGEFIGVEKLAGVLQTRLSGLSQQQRLAAFTTLFGADAIRSANILYTVGAKGVRDYVDAVTDQGAAQRMAAEQLDNLAGDLEQLKGSIETALIQGGSKATGVLRGMAQAANDVVVGFINLPSGLQGAATAGSLLVGVVGVLSGGFLLLAPKIARTIELYRTLQTTSPALAGALKLSAVGLGVVTGALAVGVGALYFYGQAKAKAKAETQEFADALQRESGGLKSEVDALLARKLKDQIGVARQLGINFRLVTAAVKGDRDAMSNLDLIYQQAARSAKNGNTESEKRAALIYLLVGRTRNLAARYREAQQDATDLATAEGVLGVKSGTAADATADLTAQIEAQQAAVDADRKRIEDLASAMAGFVGGSNALTTVLEESRQAQSDALEDRQRNEREAMAERHRAETEGLRSQAGIVGAGGKEVNAAAQRALEARQSQEERALSKRQETERRGQQEQKVSLTRFAEELEKQSRDLMAWQANLATIARRFGAPVARQVAEMGKEGAGLAASFASATDAEGKRAADALTRNAELGSTEAAQALDDGFELMARLAGEGGQKVADEFLARLREGKTDLRTLLAEYMALLTTLTVTTPDGRVIRVIDGREVSRVLPNGVEQGPGGIRYNAEGGVYERHDAVVARGGPVRVWNEPETGGESYIPHSPAKRRRSEQVLGETARIMGFRIERRHDGYERPLGATRSAATWSPGMRRADERHFALGGVLRRLPRRRLAEDEVPTSTTDGSPLVEFSHGRATYADGSTFSAAGWDRPRPTGGLRFRPDARLDASQVEDRRRGTAPVGPPATAIVRAEMPVSAELLRELAELRRVVAGLARYSTTRQYNFGGIHGLTFEQVMARAERQAGIDSLTGVG